MHSFFEGALARNSGISWAQLPIFWIVFFFRRQYCTEEESAESRNQIPMYQILHGPIPKHSKLTSELGPIVAFFATF